MLEKTVLSAARSFPAVVVTGPRRAGKSTLLRHLFPKAAYALLEDPDIQLRAKADPRSLLAELKPPVVFDEIQNVPEILEYVRTHIDARPRKMGQWLFTGSQEAPLMRGVSESMAGRAAILQLLPMSMAEHGRVSLLHGGYPEVLARPASRELWFSSYIQTYLERDVRAVTNVRDLMTFRRFLALIASRHGQVLNRSDIATPLGVSVPTIGQWIEVLEITGQLLIVPPFFENMGKRLIKSPKIYIADSGLACYLLGIRGQSELERSPFLGPVFEGAVAAEIVKHQLSRGGRRELYYFRDQQGLEVDFLFPGDRGGLRLVECKATRTPVPQMARALVSLGKPLSEKKKVQMTLVHRGPENSPAGRTLAPGVDASSLTSFAANL